MFIQLQIDRGLLQRGKEVLNRLPQNKYNEDNFHLITKGMKRDDPMAVVEMIEANLQAEIGTGGKPGTRPKPMKQVKFDYT